MGVVLGIYLSRIGFSAFRIGAVIAIGLAGSAAATTVVGFADDRFGRKRFLLLLSILTSLGVLALYASHHLPLLLAMAFVAMLNGPVSRILRAVCRYRRFVFNALSRR